MTRDELAQSLGYKDGEHWSRTSEFVNRAIPIDRQHVLSIDDFKAFAEITRTEQKADCLDKAPTCLPHPCLRHYTIEAYEHLKRGGEALLEKYFEANGVSKSLQTAIRVKLVCEATQTLDFLRKYGTD